MSGAARLRVLCYNIRHAQGIGGIISTARIGRVIAKADCDVAVLTEVWRLPVRFDQPANLGRLAGMEHAFMPLDRRLGREAGNLVLTRLPMTATRGIDLGGKRERRGCLIAELELPAGPIVLAGTHLSLHRETRSRQLEQLAEELPRDRPLVLAGDFNCGAPDLEPLRALLSVPEDPPPTYPSPLPFRALDHIAFSEHWSLESLEAVPSWASDHRPLIAELTLRAEHA